MATFPTKTTLAVAIATLGVSSVAQAQQQYGDGDDVVAISEWNYDDLYNPSGFDADWLLDRDVSTDDEDDIGSVENILVNDKNQIEAIIVQIGGVWDIGDTHVAVPWDQLDVSNNLDASNDNIQVPLNADNYDDYDLFDGDNDYVSKSALQQVAQVDDDVEAGTNIWKITDLLDDYATVSTGAGYGYVENVLFNDNGQIQAVIISGGDGAYAYPFYGYDYGWQPAYESYNLPYNEDETAGMENFNIDRYLGNE
ncbi:PRC-barrel domain-containing protein [Vreelandella glaciei]|uniref:PRC-barrel domain-containing protein n=1 Tax=Vreelandella glaciei TaxID=186761 RepID=UPI003002715B